MYECLICGEKFLNIPPGAKPIALIQAKNSNRYRQMYKFDGRVHDLRKVKTAKAVEEKA
jgi:hypothetical protein